METPKMSLAGYLKEIVGARITYQGSLRGGHYDVFDVPKEIARLLNVNGVVNDVEHPGKSTFTTLCELHARPYEGCSQPFGKKPTVWVRRRGSRVRRAS